MKMLLDTNALIWAFADPERLANDAAEKIQDETNDVLVSAVSVWEIGVKRAKGKLTMPENLAEMIYAKRFKPLPMTLLHTLAIESLPPHHHDPFDRMLVAQAQVENLVLVTSDREMRHYPIAVMPAR